MDFFKPILYFKGVIEDDSMKNNAAISTNVSTDPKCILETVLGFVSSHYSHSLFWSSSFYIILSIYSVILAVRLLCKDKKFSAGSPEYYELLKTVHSIAQNENHEENQSCKNILQQYSEMINSSMKPYDFTPFLRACWAANTDLVRFMIKQGADISKKTVYGDNGFFLAAYKVSKMKLMHWDSAIFEILLNAGIDINQQNERGYTALHVAAKGGHQLLTHWLLKHGADPNAGKEPHPLEIAHSYSKYSCLNLIPDDEKHREVAYLLAKCSYKQIKNFEETVEFTEGSSGKQLPCFFFQSEFLT